MNSGKIKKTDTKTTGRELRDNKINSISRLLVNLMITTFLLTIAIALIFPTVTAVNELGTPTINITLMSQTPDPVEPDKTTELKFTIRNRGKVAAKEVLVQIVPEFPLSVFGKETESIGDLSGGEDIGESTVLVFKIKTDKDATEGDHKVKLKIKYNGVWTETQDFVVRVRTFDSILNIEEYSFEPENIKAGEPFKLKLKLKNYADNYVRDVSVKLELDSTNFAPYKTTNVKVIKELAPYKVEGVDFKLISDNSLTSKLHKVPVKITYVNNLGSSFARNSTIGLPVSSEPEYIINIDQTEVFSKKDYGKVVVSFYNTGISDINFVTLELAENNDFEILSPKIVYLGNIESDDFESADYNLYIKEVKKEIELKLIAKFKDNYNYEYVKQISLPLKLYSEKEVIKYNLKKAESKASQIIFGMIEVLLVAFWAFMLVDCYNSKLSRNKKIAWSVIIVLSFVFGAVAYYFIGRSKAL